MSENSKIEWTDHTFNPWEGCQKVGPGCDHCYAETRNARFAGGTAINWGPGAPRRRTSASNWELPKRWNAQAEAFMNQHDRRQRVFCASLADVFDNAVDPQWRADLFALIAATPNLDWLLLTKRIGNVASMLADLAHGSDPDLPLLDMMPLPNVWLGATITSQAEADRDIPKLLALPARVRFLSMEPLLGSVDLGLQCENWTNDIVMDPETGARECCKACDYTGIKNNIDWVIVGGESGHGARPMHPDWARSLRDQCAVAGVPFLFKQWGSWTLHEVDESGAVEPAMPMSFRGMQCWRFGAWRVVDPGTKVSDLFTPNRVLALPADKKEAGRKLDGRNWDEAPAQ